MTSVFETPHSPKFSVARWEWLVLGGLLLVAVGCRLAFPGRLAVEHFDEGVYASNIWFGDSREGAYPSQHLYAPPLLPALIEWGYVFFGPSNAGAMWPNQVAGALSVLVLWWLGRSWFGPVAGLVAAALCATNEVSILLSRSALTDSLLGLWWLAALWALRRACNSGQPLDRLLAGLLVGLAWYTKYNGWMPLGIVLGAVLLRGVLCRGIWLQTRRALGTCFVSGLIAFATWAPWLWSLQSKGGYASVATNHRQYIVGFAGWWPSFLRQIEQLSAMLGPVSEGGLVASVLVLLILATRLNPAAGSKVAPAGPPGTTLDGTAKLLPPTFDNLPWLGLFILSMASLVSPILGLSGIALQGLGVWWWRSSRQVAETSRGDRTELGVWILLVWFAGLWLAIPMYRSYLRLTLPWLLAACLGVGLALQQAWSLLLPAEGAEPFPRIVKFRSGWNLVVTALTVWIAWSFSTPTGIPAIRESLLRAVPDQSSLPAAAKELAATVLRAAGESGSEAMPTAVYVYGEPSLLFQLRNAGLENVAPASSLEFAQSQFSNAGVRIYLAVGIHAEHDSNFREQFAAARSQFRKVGSWPWRLGPLVALDQSDCDPRKLGHNPTESATVELYEVQAP